MANPSQVNKSATQKSASPQSGNRKPNEQQKPVPQPDKKSSKQMPGK